MNQLRNILTHLKSRLIYPASNYNPYPKEAVDKDGQAERGYNGEDVYSVSGGNPFYVNEILAKLQPGYSGKYQDSLPNGVLIGWREKTKQGVEDFIGTSGLPLRLSSI